MIMIASRRPSLMMATMKLTHASFLIALLLSGCTTLDSQHRREMESRTSADLVALQQRTAALQQRVEALEVVREESYAHLDHIRTGLKRLEADLARQRSDQATAIQAEAAAREAMRMELVRSLSERITEIMRTHAPQPKPAQVQSGYEHTVKPGETLSEIARAYGVGINAIIRANNIQRPDSLRVGETLFIPE